MNLSFDNAPGSEQPLPQETHLSVLCSTTACQCVMASVGVRQDLLNNRKAPRPACWHAQFINCHHLWGGCK